jgi:glycosyltransferase involved in cell wall biosynthesis
MKFAVDLLWVRPNKVGGTEFYIRNILNGFMELKQDFEIVLILSLDNSSSFEEYFADKRFRKIICNIQSENVGKRIIWQNRNLNRLLVRENIRICYEPVYSKPLINSKKVKYITTIHDLQALHFPQYQSFLKVLWLKLCWKKSIRSSYKVIAISDFVKNDIIKNYKVTADKVQTIYNAIDIDLNDTVDFEPLRKKYGIEKNSFYYTVSSLATHKNLITIVNLIKVIKDRNLNMHAKLLVSGIGGKDKDKLVSFIQENNLQDNILLTGFVSISERNTLYKNCNAFLFPSIFEGFGMPPVEAMAFGSRVITTKVASIYEVTQGKALYVSNPFDIEDWINALTKLETSTQEAIDLMIYHKKRIALQIYHLLEQI